MRDRIWQAVADVRSRLREGWLAWETTAGPMWARVTEGWQGARQVESEPMTEDEESIVDYVLQEEDLDGNSQPG